MSPREWVEIIAAGTMPLAISALIVNRIRTGKGIGVRTIQFLAIATFVPAVLIIALETIIDGSTVAALIGAFIGYLFSNIAEFDRRSGEVRGTRND